MTKKEEFEQAKQVLEQNFDSAWNTILSLANSDYEEAMEFVALAYYRGEGIEMDEPLAYQWFHKIVRLYPSNGFIWNKIADCHFYGYGVPENQDEAIQYYQKAWEYGIADAGTDIGWIYAFGDTANHNELTAAKWFQRAADKGSSQGMYFMGYFYSEGYGGLPVSEKMAAKYLRQAAASNNFSAIRYLLCKKCYGDNTEFVSLRQKLFEMAESGDDRAQKALGFAYLFGGDWESAFGLEKNPTESQRWFELSAQQGNIDSLYELGKNLLDYDSGFTVDVDRGEQCLLQAAEKEKADAYYELYRLYKWTKRDQNKALLWAERAVENGNSFLIRDIADCYFNGEGAEVDYEKAASYYRRCVKDDLEDYQSNVSYLPLAKCCLLSSYPTEQKYKDAYVYLKLALDAANEKDYCSQQKGEIEYWIAYMLDSGLGVPSNLEEAFRHYSKSAELGFEKAQEEIQHFKKSIFGWKKI